MKCKRCGQCCENMALEIKPEELKKSYEDWFNNKKDATIFKHIWLVYPMLRFIKFDRKVGRYRYRCIHFGKKNGVGFCEIHENKPQVCSSYGTPSEQEKLNMAIHTAQNKKLYPDCVF